MRTLLLLTSLLLLLSAGQAEAQRRQRRPREPREPVELTHYSYELVKFEALSLESSEGELGVYLPIGYQENEDQSYPWVLWLHGLNEDASRFHYEGGAKVLDQLTGEGKIPPLILVAPSAPRRTIYANGESEGDVQDYVHENVIPYVEENYRISEERENFAIMGVSMGGMGALRFALSEPDRYGTVAVHSAAAFPADPSLLDAQASARVQRTIQFLGLGDILGDPIDPVRWAKYIPAAMIADISADDLDGLRIYFDAGTADRYGFGPPNEQFHEQLAAQEIEHEFTLVENGGHSWGSGSLQKQLIYSLQFVGAGFTVSSAAK